MSNVLVSRDLCCRVQQSEVGIRFDSSAASSFRKRKCSTLHCELHERGGLDKWWSTTVRKQLDGVPEGICKLVRLFKCTRVMQHLIFFAKWIHSLRHCFCDHDSCLTAVHLESVYYLLHGEPWHKRWQVGNTLDHESMSICTPQKTTCETLACTLDLESLHCLQHEQILLRPTSTLRTSQAYQTRMVHATRCSTSMP